MTTEWRIWKCVEGNSHGLFWDLPRLVTRRV